MGWNGGQAPRKIQGVHGSPRSQSTYLLQSAWSSSSSSLLATAPSGRMVRTESWTCQQARVQVCACEAGSMATVWYALMMSGCPHLVSLARAAPLLVGIHQPYRLKLQSRRPCRSLGDGGENTLVCTRRGPALEAALARS